MPPEAKVLAGMYYVRNYNSLGFQAASERPLWRGRGPAARVRCGLVRPRAGGGAAIPTGAGISAASLYRSLAKPVAHHRRSHVIQSTSRELGEFWHIDPHKRLNDPRESCVECSLIPGPCVPASRAYEPYDRAGRSPRAFPRDEHRPVGMHLAVVWSLCV